MSTASSIGREEERKPLIDAYMFERRILLGCNALVFVAVIFWIAAISTDHWFIISGGQGIYNPESRRYFISSHSGLWKVCKYESSPYLLANSASPRNLTSLQYSNPPQVRAAKAELAKQPFIDTFRQRNVQLNVTEITNPFKQQLFAHWVRSENEEFKKFKANFREVVKPIEFAWKNNMKPVLVDSRNISAFPPALKEATTHVVNGSIKLNILVPSDIRTALFDGWQEKPEILPLIYPFSKEMELIVFILDDKGSPYMIQPPLPEGKRFNYGYEYIPYTKCKYHDLFPSQSSIDDDPSIDDEILDYGRTQASFACIGVLIMLMGVAFSLYTFLNPRYMFKRLAGGIHFISAAATMVVIQVLIASVEYQKAHTMVNFPEGSTYTFGYGAYFAYGVFASNLFAAIMFMWYSRKKKGSKAPTDEIGMADEPTVIGR